MTKPNAADLVRRNPDTLFTGTPDGYMALDIETGNCFALSVTASRVWELIEHPITVLALRDRLTAEFEVTGDVCLDQTLELLTGLIAAGIVRVESAV